MRKTTNARWSIGLAGAVLIISGCHANADRPANSSASAASTIVDSDQGSHQGLLYGRVTLNDGAKYEGRLRFGGNEEALWGNYFNGARGKNPWADRVPQDRIPKRTESIEIFGAKIGAMKETINLSRPFMARFGDIARIDAHDRDLSVTLKSGTVVHLNRYGADDFADGVRVWDPRRTVDLDEWGIRSIEFLPATDSGTAPLALYGTVHTAQGDFTGLIQWDREECLASDILYGIATEQHGVHFGEIRSIARRSPDSSVVTLRDGREVALSGRVELTIAGKKAIAPADRGIYVDDARYGRVLVSWDSFERVDFSEGRTGPAYGEFPSGHQLTGSVTTKSGRRISGRIVYDLDESETSETLDAQLKGVNYSIPFGLIESISLPATEARSAQRVNVRLYSGEELPFGPSGDLTDQNAGMLVFVEGNETPEYILWSEIAKIDFLKSVR